MWSENEIGYIAQRRLRGQRFRFENVESSGRDMAGSQSLGERGFIDEPAAGAIDYPHPASRFGQPRRVDKMMGLRRERRVERDEISAGQKIIEVIHQFD